MTALTHDAAVREAAAEETGRMAGHLADFHAALGRAREASDRDSMEMFALDMREAYATLLAAAGCCLAAAIVAERKP